MLSKDIVFREDLYPRFEPNQRIIQEYSESIEYLPPIEVNQIMQTENVVGKLDINRPLILLQMTNDPCGILDYFELYFHLPAGTVRLKKNTREVTEFRHLAALMLLELGISKTEIAKSLNYNRSTVYNSKTQAENLISIYPKYRDMWNKIKQDIIPLYSKKI